MNANEIKIVVSGAAKRACHQYPQCEWDDLEAQAWLIVTEFIGDFDASKGASLTTYLYNTLEFKLSDYIRRYVLKELNMNGNRVHADHYDADIPDIAHQVEAKMMVDKILESVDGVSGDILKLTMAGYSQAEVGKMVGLSRARVCQIPTSIREEYIN